MKDADYLFIVNPISGGFSKEAFYAFIEEENEKHLLSFDIYETKGKNDEERLAIRSQKNRYSAVIAVGGDGTLLLVVRVFIDMQVPIGLIPLGSANGMAKELGISGGADSLKSLIIREKIRSAWSIIQKKNIRKIDILRINRKFYSLHLSDIGLNAELIKRFEKEKIRGYKGYARQFLKEFRQKKEIRYRIWTDGRKHKGHAYMICIANATMYGNGAVINSNGKPDDGHFEIVVVRNIRIGSLLTALVSIFKKNVKYAERDLKVYTCKRAVISLKKTKTLQVDGEIAGDFDRVEVEIIPRAVRIIS